MTHSGQSAIPPLDNNMAPITANKQVRTSALWRQSQRLQARSTGSERRGKRAATTRGATTPSNPTATKSSINHHRPSPHSGPRDQNSCLNRHRKVFQIGQSKDHSEAQRLRPSELIEFFHRGRRLLPLITPRPAPPDSKSETP